MFWIAESLCRKPCQGSQPYSWTVSPCRIWSTCSPTSSPGSEKKRQSSRWAFGSTHLNLLRRSLKMLQWHWYDFPSFENEGMHAELKKRCKTSRVHIFLGPTKVQEKSHGYASSNSDSLPFLSAEARSLSLPHLCFEALIVKLELWNWIKLFQELHSTISFLQCANSWSRKLRGANPFLFLNMTKRKRYLHWV